MLFLSVDFCKKETQSWRVQVKRNCFSLKQTLPPRRIKLYPTYCLSVTSRAGEFRLLTGGASGRILIDGDEILTGLTLPETNNPPLKIVIPKRKFILQPSIFRCYVSFGKGSTLIMTQHISISINWQCFFLFWIAPTVVGTNFWRKPTHLEVGNW